jgi:hypothetical protein
MIHQFSFLEFQNMNEEPVIGYMDKTDFDHELGHARDGNTIYPSVQALRDGSGHDVSECGIVKVSVSLVEIVQKAKYVQSRRTS